MIRAEYSVRKEPQTDIVKIKSGLSLTCDITVTDIVYSTHPVEVICDLQHRIESLLYGDLHRKLCELRNITMMNYSNYESSNKISEKFEEIFDLIKVTMEEL